MGLEPVQLKEDFHKKSCLKEEDYSWVGEVQTKQAKSIIKSVFFYILVFKGIWKAWLASTAKQFSEQSWNGGRIRADESSHVNFFFQLLIISVPVTFSPPGTQHVNTVWMCFKNFFAANSFRFSLSVLTQAPVCELH